MLPHLSQVTKCTRLNSRRFGGLGNGIASKAPRFQTITLYKFSLTPILKMEAAYSSTTMALRYVKPEHQDHCYEHLTSNSQTSQKWFTWLLAPDRNYSQPCILLCWTDCLCWKMLAESAACTANQCLFCLVCTNIDAIPLQPEKHNVTSGASWYA
jgi:hypothetical protein